MWQDKTIGINGIALLSPLTGIGQYTLHLVRALQGLLPQAPWLFYAKEWSQALRTTPGTGVVGAKNLIRRCLPYPYEVTRFLLQRSFNLGVRRHKIALYHEPNFLAYRYRGPTVVTVHDLSWVRYPETQPADRVRIMNRLMPEVVARADHLLADSAFVRDEIIQHYGVPPDKISAVLLGVSPAFAPRDAMQCAVTLAKYGVQHGRYFLAVGTREPRKNLGAAIAAYVALPESVRSHYPLVVAGMRGWGEDSLQHSSAVRAAMEKRQIIFTDYVPQAELPLLYAGARLFVYPSLYEGFGLPPLEAMACGVPVIVSNRASLPEVVGDSGILVQPEDDAAIAQQMHRLVEDATLHQRLSAAGLARAQALTWERCAIATLAVYAKVIAQ